MRVYHGSYVAIDKIDLSQSRTNKDFGRGFYVTKLREQAEIWAGIIGGIHDVAGVVSEFIFCERAMEMKIKSEEKEKEFDTVKTFRKIKENISKDIWGLSYEELIKYLQNQKTKSAVI